HAPVTTDTYTLSLHDALPILSKKRITFFNLAFGNHQYPEIPGNMEGRKQSAGSCSHDQYICILYLHVFFPPTFPAPAFCPEAVRSEEHTSELQSRFDLVCRLL